MGAGFNQTKPDYESITWVAIEIILIARKRALTITPVYHVFRKKRKKTKQNKTKNKKTKKQRKKDPRKKGQ